MDRTEVECVDYVCESKLQAQRPLFLTMVFSADANV
jgi:hypothetical protein